MAYFRKKKKMTNKSKNQILWGIRILVSALFILSAIAKMYPSPIMGIATFEAKYLGAIGIDGALAKIVSRMLIGFEFSLAVLLLLPYYLKKIIIPVTITLLALFSVHLFVQVINGEASNCGCFGELIPMTPLEALIKNILTILLLILPYTLLKESLQEKNKMTPVSNVFLSASLLMFVFFPQGSSSISGVDSDSNESVYNQYFDDISKGNKLLCFFSPTCEHCMETGKKIKELSEQFPGMMPEVRILFMDESDNGSEKEVKDYFTFVGRNYDYRVLTIEEFVPLFWANKDFPGVLYMNNGNERIFFDGSGDNSFDEKKLFDEIKKEY